MSKLTIPEVDDLDVAFSTGEKTPKLKDIPEEFHRGQNPYVKLFDEIFFKGYDLEKLTVKPDIDLKRNLRFFRHCASTFSTPHEHKTAACAWILSETFEEPTFD